jgi:hypothetical protein
MLAKFGKAAVTQQHVIDRHLQWNRHLYLLPEIGESGDELVSHSMCSESPHRRTWMAQWGSEVQPTDYAARRFENPVDRAG